MLGFKSLTNNLLGNFAYIIQIWSMLVCKNALSIVKKKHVDFDQYNNLICTHRINCCFLAPFTTEVFRPSYFIENSWLESGGSRVET